eukprot:SAG22_NODE_1259_length_4983_cov_2.399877_3_plen_94_part_00
MTRRSGARWMMTKFPNKFCQWSIIVNVGSVKASIGTHFMATAIVRLKPQQAAPGRDAARGSWPLAYHRPCRRNEITPYTSKTPSNVSAIKKLR